MSQECMNYNYNYVDVFIYEWDQKMNQKMKKQTSLKKPL